MSDAALRDGVFESGFDVFLADKLRKRLRPVLAGDDLIRAIGVQVACEGD